MVSHSVPLSAGRDPVRNTGSNSQELLELTHQKPLQVRIDYLRGTCKLPNHAWVEAAVNAVLKAIGDEGIWEHGQGSLQGIQWHNRGHSIKGFKWWWNDRTDDVPTTHLMLQLSGSVLKGMEVKAVHELCRLLVDVFKFKVTRIDIALDDYEKRLSFKQIRNAVDKDNYARVNGVTPCYSFKRNKGLNGFSFYVGSKSSEKYGVIYDKEIESKGEIKAIRMEGRFMDSYAQKLMKQWLSISANDFDERSPQFLAGKVTGLVTFCYRYNRKEKNISRLIMLPWWKKFVDAVGASLRHSVPREDITFERCRAWVERQVTKTLVVLQKVMGRFVYRHWMHEQMAKAAADLGTENEMRIVQWSKGNSDIEHQTVGYTLVEKTGTGEQKWAWVWRETAQCAEWMLGRLDAVTDDSARVRFSGEGWQTVPLVRIHCGQEKPTWVPGGSRLKEDWDWVV